MVKYFLKNRAVYSIVLAVLIGIFSTFLFVQPSAETRSENLLLTSVYENSDIDYDIPSPTKSQLAEIEALDFVDDAFGYYFTDGSLKVGSKSVKTKIIFGDDLDSLGITMYNEDRLIYTSQDGLYENPLYVDYDFYTKNKLSIGDTVYFNNIEFQIGRVYETNSYYGSATFIPLVGAQKTYIESITKSYSGAYLKVNDGTKAEAYLRNYKPLGRLKDKSDFATDTEYQTHYNSWNNASYYNEITSFSSKLASANVKTEANYTLGFIISAVVMVIVNVILSIRKNERIYFYKKKNKASVGGYYIATVLMDTILMAASLLIGIFIVKNNIVTFVPGEYFTSIIVTAIITTIGAMIINAVYDFIFCKKIVSNK